MIFRHPLGTHAAALGALLVLISRPASAQDQDALTSPLHPVDPPPRSAPAPAPRPAPSAPSPSAPAPPPAASAPSPSPAAPPPAAPAPDAPAPNTALPPLADTLTGSAKDDYTAGRLLYEDSDFAGALVKYTAAYKASHDARLLWNAATCEKNLRHYAKAVTLVNRFLQAGHPYVTADTERDAHTFLDAVKPLTAAATIVATEPDAAISVDGEKVGVTPITEPVLVDIGARRFSADKDGYKPFAATVDVAGSQGVLVEVKLVKIVHQGRLVVHAEAADTIVIDGHGVGSGTLEAMLASGGHTLRVTAPDMHPFQQEILIQDGESRTIDVSLEPVSSGIPAWVWIVGGGVLAAGAATGGYFLFKPSDTTGASTPGTIQPGTVQLPLMR